MCWPGSTQLFVFVYCELILGPLLYFVLYLYLSYLILGLPHPAFFAGFQSFAGRQLLRLGEEAAKKSDSLNLDVDI